MVKPNIKMAMNTVTIKPVPFVDKFELISKAGFSGVGLWMDEIQDYLKVGTGKPIRELLEDCALTPVEMQVVRKWQYLTGSEKERAFDEAGAFFAEFSKLDIQCPVIGLPSEEVGEIRNAIEDFKRLCHLAGDFGLSVAFEFIGWAKQFNNVKTAWEVVGEADCPNGGLLIDTFHFVKAGSTIEDLKRVPIEKVFLVHVNDAKPLPLGIKEQSRGHRFYPGEGEARIQEIMDCFVESGYDGFYCCEIFNEEYWQDDPLTVVTKSKNAMDALFQ
jgi:4-hydroxyphenylpyruvate dioxygenase